MPYMTRIAADLIAEGVTVEYVTGWQTRGSSSFAPAVVVNHWTAGPRATTTRPSLNVVTFGRSGLPGPLCNVYLARNGTAIIVAAGRANHAGAGSWRGVIGNSGAYGIEAESAGNNDWTDEQRAAYPRVVAGLLRGLDRSADWTCGHNEWAPTRKIDIRDWPMSLMRQEVATILSAPPAGEALLEEAEEEDDMIKGYAIRNYNGAIGLISPDGTLDHLTSSAWAALTRAGFVDGYKQEDDGSVWNGLVEYTLKVRAAQAGVSPEELARQVSAIVVPAVVDALPDTVTEAEVEAIVKSIVDPTDPVK